MEPAASAESLLSLPAGPTSAADLATRLAAEALEVQGEVEEIELLINQARTEASRHEARRNTAAEKLAMGAERLVANAGITPKELQELANQLVAVARRAALMEAQVDLLEGKRRSAARLHDATMAHAMLAREVAGLPDGGGGQKALKSGKHADDQASVEAGGPMPPGVSRMILTAQEDLRREIARQMHDGPAQSLTNIVLQAQIVDRLLARDPEQAAPEVQALIGMVQRTLEATKTFIFDVRPMVLDDLGLVPTLRKASRERGRRANVKVDFESVGVDRRLPMELETGLFRIIDEALAAHVAGKPESLLLRMDWSDKLEIELTAGRAPQVAEVSDIPADGAELPPALAEMVEERRAAHRAAVEEARVAGLARLPERLWREVSGRAETLGIQAELLDEGARLRLIVTLPEGAATGLGHAATTATR